MGSASSPAPGTTPPPNTPHTPKTPSRQQKRAELKKKYYEKMGTPSPSNSAGSLTSTPSSSLTINTAITTPPLLQGPLPKGITLTPRTQAWYDEIHGNNNANQAPMQMAFNIPTGMVPAQADGLAINYGNGAEVPQVNNMVNKFNGTANNTVAEGPGKDFYAFLEKMKANPADHITMVDQQETVDNGSAINYDTGMAAPEANMTTTAFDDRMDANMGSASYTDNNNGPYFINNDNSVHTTIHDNGADINGTGAMSNPAPMSEENSMQGFSAPNTFSPGVGSNMFDASEALLDYSTTPLDFSVWDDFINMQPSGAAYISSPGNDFGSSGAATVHNDIAPTSTASAPTSSETVGPAAIANLSFGPASANNPATAATASPDANIMSSVPEAANTIPATTVPENAAQTQNTAVRKSLFGLLQIGRTSETTIDAERTAGPGADGMIESLNILVEDARRARVSDGGILFVLQEYVRMYKHGDCY